MGRKKADITTETRNEADIVICKFRYKLDAEQQDFLRNHYHEYKGDIIKLSRECMENPDLTSDSEEIANVKRFIVRIRKKSAAYPFSKEQIDYILDNAEGKTPIEICRELLPDIPHTPGNLTLPAQTAAEIIQAYGVEYTEPGKVPLNTGKYAPPRTLSKIVACINEADMNARFHINDLKADSKKRNCATALLRNMHSARFIATASAYRDKQLVRLFETEFVKSTYDKPDLTAEEANQYISLCNEYVKSVTLEHQQAELDDKLRQALINGDTGSSKEYNKNISDSRAAVAGEFHQCQDRIKKLQESLNVKRSKRLELEGQANESLAKWIDLVQMEEGREKLRRLEEARNIEIAGEIKRIENFSDMIAEFAGVSAEELLKCRY